MSGCNKITASILLDCTVPLIGGNDDTLYLFNRSEIVGVTRNVTNPQIIEALTLDSTTPVLVVDTIKHGSVTGGPYTVGETITGGTSGFTGVFVSDDGTFMVLSGITGTPVTGETLVGGTSAASSVSTTTTVYKKGFKYEGRNGSLEPAQRLVIQKFSRVFDHECKFKVFSALPATKVQLELLVSDNVVAVVENNNRGVAGEGAFEIYGLDTGLEVSALERVIQNIETGGAFDLTLITTERSKEPHLPATFFITDYATTKALLLSYID